MKSIGVRIFAGVARWLSVVICICAVFGAVILYLDRGFENSKVWFGLAVVLFGFGSFAIHDFATRKKVERWLESPEVAELTKRYQCLVPTGESTRDVEERLTMRMQLDGIGTGFLRVPQLGFRTVRVSTFSDGAVEMRIYSFKDRVIASDVHPKEKG